MSTFSQYAAAPACRPLPFHVTVLLLFIALSAGALSQTNDECLACHGEASLTTERNGKEVSLFVKHSVLKASPHRKLACVSCHAGFKPEDLPHKEKIEPVKCTTCHLNAVIKHRFHSVMLEKRKKAGTLDGACKDCHGRHDVVSPRVPGSKFSTANLGTSCGQCHSEVTEKFNLSAHGVAMRNNVKGAPTCIACHSNQITWHEGVKDSVTVKIAQEQICLSCHRDNPDVRARTNPGSNFIAAYDKSVHGMALKRGNAHAANCVSCHGSHEMQKSLAATSRTNKQHVPAACRNCHPAVDKVYEESIHGKSLKRGNPDAPACTDCHGEHNILASDDPNSPVSARNVSLRVCSPCHGSLKLNDKYGIASNRTQSYATSYHGLASRGGSTEVANCGSCHGSHNIKPSSDPTSMVHKANLVQTCGRCHPGANERFTMGSVHVTYAEKEEPLLYWVATIYLIMIIVVIGGMFVHNVADFRRKSVAVLQRRRGIIPHHQPRHRLYVRMTGLERFQHASLLISFFLLVITGFMLRFPDAWWVVYIRQISSGAFELRSLIHRIAGVAMVAASLYHIWYISFTPRGRQLIRDILPRLTDIGDAIAVLKYNFGFSKTRPKFDRFSYIEKSEYWALVWGTFIMAATGVILWFDNYFMGVLTKLGWDVARTVHYYEAWLAFLAIIVWHLYFVIFNPDTYPMNLAWIKGTLTEEEMMDEHPLELERLLAHEDEVILTQDNDGDITRKNNGDNTQSNGDTAGKS